MDSNFITASGAINQMGITPAKFIRLLDLGCFQPQLSGSRWVLFDKRQLKKVIRSPERPKAFPAGEFATVKQALALLDISRRTFYIRVNRGDFVLHKSGKLSFVKLTDLYADAELF